MKTMSKAKIIFMLTGVLLIGNGQLSFAGPGSEGPQTEKNTNKQTVRENYELYMIKIIQQCIDKVDEVLLDLLGENGKTSRDETITDGLPVAVFQEVEEICIKMSSVRPILRDSENAIRSKDKARLEEVSDALESAGLMLQGCYKKLMKISRSNGDKIESVLKPVNLVAQRMMLFPQAIEGFIEVL